MRNFTVTVLDTAGIQSYIFGSNRLRENIGASYLVTQATDDWVRETLTQLGVPKNWQYEPIEESGLAAEIVYAGGGNAMLLFKSNNVAVEFAQKLSRRILEKAPGINLVIAHQEFDWDNASQPLYKVVHSLIKDDLECQKYERVSSAPLLGLGVTASCNSTQLPAVNTSDEYLDADEQDHYWISREIEEKLRAVKPTDKTLKSANQVLNQKFAGSFNQDVYQFPYRTDYLGRSQDESSYVAVVHADVNGMGKRFQKHGEGKPNRQYVDDMRELSQSVDKAGMKALKAIVRVIEDSIKDGQVIGKLGQFSLKPGDKGKFYLPFRPLVYGGDDVTFVCEGRLGLELAALYLQELEKQPVADGELLKACAGICVVKTHYPFARAYKISEDLCKKAKSFVKETEEFEPKGFSALDWHFAASGLLGTISEIRDREYCVQIPEYKKPASLAMRPVRLNDNGSDWRTWSGFTQVVKEFSTGKDWKGRKNKVLVLREVLRGGINTTQQFIQTYRLQQLPRFPESSGQSEQLARDGWLNRACGYFDAIEAMEFYLALGE